MNFTPLALEGVVLVEPRIWPDGRGFFFESWHEEKFRAAGIDARFVQDNHSRSVQGTLRGLHYQMQHAQGKLVRVTMGEVFDVVVDIRKHSPTFGQWLGVTLSAENKHMLWVPPGFAHGFYVVSDCADFLYKCTDVYAPEYERTIRWNDAALGIEWPLVDGQAPILSKKDAAGVLLADAEVYP
jgi:dTDP-4-dehydrorhamnose 3,5-epimerase